MCCINTAVWNAEQLRDDALLEYTRWTTQSCRGDESPSRDALPRDGKGPDALSPRLWPQGRVRQLLWLFWRANAKCRRRWTGYPETVAGRLCRHSRRQNREERVRPSSWWHWWWDRRGTKTQRARTGWLRPSTTHLEWCTW